MGQNRNRNRADIILSALQKKHTDKQHPDAFFTQVKNGPTHTAQRGELRILDGLAVKKSWAQPCLTGYEVKVSRSDFLSDDKWTDYLPLCHELYFVCPSGLIKPEEVGEEVGLIYYNGKSGSLATIKKAIYRNIELPTDMLYYIIMSRIEDDRHPFFSTQREMLEAWVEDKESRNRLAHRVRGKLWETIEKQQVELDELRRKVYWNEYNVRDLQEIRSVLQAFGLNIYPRGLEKDLRAMTKSAIPSGMMRSIDRLLEAADVLKTLVNRTKEQLNDNQS